MRYEYAYTSANGKHDFVKLIDAYAYLKKKASERHVVSPFFYVNIKNVTRYPTSVLATVMRDYFLWSDTCVVNVSLISRIPLPTGEKS